MFKYPIFLFPNLILYIGLYLINTIADFVKSLGIVDTLKNISSGIKEAFNLTEWKNPLDMLKNTEHKQQALDEIKAEKDTGEGAYRATVDITPFEHGERDVEVVEALFNGEEFTEQVIIPAKAVTWDNIDEYFE